MIDQKKNNNVNPNLTMDGDLLKQFLLRGWMTHDAMWFKNTQEKYGAAVANELNRAAIRDMASVEVQRLLKVLCLKGVATYSEVKTFMVGAINLLSGDYMQYKWQWNPPDTLCVNVSECFAFKGLSRLGAIEHYECGIFDRVFCWFNTLGLNYTFSPAVEHCTMHYTGRCIREIRFNF